MKEEIFGREAQYARVPREGLSEVDDTVAELIDAEVERQERKLIFIASESICPPPVRRVMATPLSNIYAEGYPAPRMNVLTEEEIAHFDDAFVNFKRYSDRRYYKGTDYMNVLESLAKRRCADLFANERVGSDHIFANVQPLSGAAANNAVYGAFLENGDRILGMSLVSGGHLTHGSPVNRSGRSYCVASYSVGRDGRLDYEAIAQQAKEFKPRLIVAGFSAYPWDIDWEALRQAADSVGALLMADISHTAGLVAAGAVKSPIGYADVMTFTTHKTLCGPRGAVILTTDEARAKAVDLAVFPGEQGGPHMHQIAAKAVAFKLAQGKPFQDTMKTVVSNASAMAESFEKRGVTLAYGGTDTHLLLLDLRKIKTASGKPITGEIASRLLDSLGITCNKNTIAGDKSANHPSGLRFGTTWVTQRGFGPKELDQVADLVVKVLENAHAYTYFYAGGDVGRSKLDFDLMEEVQQGVERLVQKAGDVKGDWEKTYPHYAPAVEGEGEDEGATDGEPQPTPLSAPALEAGSRGKTRGGVVYAAAYGDEEKERQAATTSAGIFDMGGAVWVRVTGRRAAQFLASVTTADVLGMEVGAATSALVLGPSGELLSGATVLREESGETSRAWTDSFVVRLGPLGRPVYTLRWLRALSDGYVYHDEDIYLKAEGPAVITPLEDDEGPVTAFFAAGPEAAKVVETVMGKDARLEVTDTQGRFAEVKMEEASAWVVRHCGAEHAGFEILARVDAAVTLWGRFVEAGAVPCGVEAADVVHASMGWPQGEPTAEALVASPLSNRVEAGKPFFVGQKAWLEAVKESKEGAEEVKKALEPLAAEAWKPVLDIEEESGRKTCLYEEHQKLTKKRNIVPFAGWQMPVWYESISAEHEAVRKGAGLFDVSHMGVLSFEGAMAERFLDMVTTNYVPWLNPGQCHYSYLLDFDGNVIDDIIVYREGRHRFMMVVNAANAEADEAWMRAINQGNIPLDAKCPLKAVEGAVEIRNMKLDESLGERRRVDIAFQGQASLPTLHKLMTDPVQKAGLAEMGPFTLMTIKVQDMELLVAKTGYTGEAVGFELFPHPEQAPKLWNLLLEAGEELGVVPAGLGSRDSTRLEAGFPLHGHELAGPHAINPLEAGYAPFVRLHKPYFVGRDAMVHAYENWKRAVVRIQTVGTGGRTIRPGAPVVDARRGTCVGTVTSAVTVDRYQVCLAIVDRKKVRNDDHLMVFPATGGGKKKGPKAPGELQPGDRTALPLEAKVISRFMKPGETRESALQGDEA